MTPEQDNRKRQSRAVTTDEDNDQDTRSSPDAYQQEGMSTTVHQDAVDGTTHHHHRDKRHRTMCLLDKSGYTERQRQQLRKEQRTLNESVVFLDSSSGTSGGAVDANKCNARPDGNSNESGRSLEDAVKINNTLFKKVRHTREAVLDSENICAITRQYVHEYQKDLKVPSFDANKLVVKLRGTYTIDAGGDSRERASFDWAALDKKCGRFFNPLPVAKTHFLAGILDQARLTKVKKRTPRVKNGSAVSGVDETECYVLESVEGQEQQQGPSLVTAAARKQMRKVLKRRSGENGGQEIDGVQFLVNPKSFTQTVENIFNFSFMVKNGDAEIGTRGTSEEQSGEHSGQNSSSTDHATGLYVKARHSSSTKPTPLAKQSILKFTVADWKTLCQAGDLTDGDLPDRST